MLDMLFCAAKWLSYAKLHLHTDSTLKELEECTVQYGKLSRRIELETVDAGLHETARERKIRLKRQQAGNTTSQPAPAHLSTIKNHWKAHYSPSIRGYGTCDSWSTSMVRQNHQITNAQPTLSFLLIGREPAQACQGQVAVVYKLSKF